MLGPGVFHLIAFLQDPVEIAGDIDGKFLFGSLERADSVKDVALGLGERLQHNGAPSPPKEWLGNGEVDERTVGVISAARKDPEQSSADVQHDDGSGSEDAGEHHVGANGCGALSGTALHTAGIPVPEDMALKGQGQRRKINGFLFGPIFPGVFGGNLDTLEQGELQDWRRKRRNTGIGTFSIAAILVFTIFHDGGQALFDISPDVEFGEPFQNPLAQGSVRLLNGKRCGPEAYFFPLLINDLIDFLVGIFPVIFNATTGKSEQERCKDRSQNHIVGKKHEQLRQKLLARFRTSN